MEVWNGPWGATTARALGWWEAHLRRGDRIVALGGSDTHLLRRAPGSPFPARLGQPTTWAHTDDPPTSTSVLAALRAGRCFISASPSGPQLYLSHSPRGLHVRTVGAMGTALLLISDGGCLSAHAVPADDWDHEFPPPPRASYVRAQLVKPQGTVLALTNPNWRED